MGQTWRDGQGNRDGLGERVVVRGKVFSVVCGKMVARQASSQVDGACPSPLNGKVQWRQPRGKREAALNAVA